jgi:hypothetical protein
VAIPVHKRLAPTAAILFLALLPQTVAEAVRLTMVLALLWMANPAALAAVAHRGIQ